MNSFEILIGLYHEMREFYRKDPPFNSLIIRALEKQSVFDSNHIEALRFISEQQPMYFLLFYTGHYKPYMLLSDFYKALRNPAYKEYRIPKKNGGYRTVYAPEGNLKRLQKGLNKALQRYYSYIKPDCVFGFTTLSESASRCNIADNAARHTGKRFVLNIDLKDFFPSITGEMVYSMFSSNLFYFSKETAKMFSLLTLYHGRLPAGAPTSPIVSNLVCLPLDRELMLFSSQYDVVYTRYADDLTFSSDKPFSRKQIADITALIRRYGFEVNHRKFRLQPTSTRQTVTGLVVNRKVNIERRKLKKLRAVVHDVNRHGMREAAMRNLKLEKISKEQLSEFADSLEGYIGFVRQVKGKEYVAYLLQNGKPKPFSEVEP